MARALLEKGHQVRALVRDKDKAPARALADAGAELVVASYEDPDGLREAARGVSGIFSVQPADFADPYGGTEVSQGMAVADAARAANVNHLVYSSVGGAERDSKVAHFDTKAVVERYIAALRVPATILRPVLFMENWTYMLPASTEQERVVPLALSPDTKLQMVAQSDIGRIVAEVFDHPGEFLGERLEIAGDELSVTQIAETFQEIDGVPTRSVPQPIAELRHESSEAADMFAWFESEGYRAEIAALRERFPELQTLRSWLRESR